MGTTPSTSSLSPGGPPRRGATESARIAMGVFIFTEVMMFAGFISAFVIVQSNAIPGTWPPPGQPRLPIESTAVNTLALLASGVLLFIAGRRFKRDGALAARRWMSPALILGGIFVLGQGREWFGLIKQGMTMTSSQLGSFFYLIIGMHALHAIAAIVALLWALNELNAGRLTVARFGAVQLFWFFVVLIWPVLYALVYL